MNGHRSLVATVAALCALAAPAGAAHAQRTTYDGGAPDGGAGWLVADGTRSADDFLLDQAIGFDGIRFWGLLPTGALYAPTIFWEILADDAGVPSATPASGGAAVATVTWRGASDFVGFDSWQIDLAVGARTLGAGHYWLALHDGPTDAPNYSSLVWETTAGGHGADYAVEDFGIWTGQWDGNLAFQMTQSVPEPATVTLVAGGLLALAAAARRERPNA